MAFVFAVSCQNKGTTYSAGNPLGEGPMPVNIGLTYIPGDYVILAEAGITNTGTSVSPGPVIVG